MPIYEYQCDKCGFQFEQLQKVSDDPLKNCPECSQDSLRKLVSAAGFQLKGTGWYVTDFRDKGKKAANDNASQSEAPATESAKTDNAKTDTTTSSASSSDSGKKDND